MLRYIALCYLIFGTFPALRAQEIRILEFTSNSPDKDSSYAVPAHGDIMLDYRQTNISVTFSDTADTIGAQYAFRLDGFDTAWRGNQNLTRVMYVNLFGGNYTFRVKNLNHPDKEATVRFHIEKAFWQQFWFVPMLTAYVLLIAGIIFYFFRIYRLRSQIRVQNLRNEIASDLHDDIGSTLSSISFLGEMARLRLEKKPGEIPGILDKIIFQSKEMMQTMRGMVWSIQPNNDSAADFFEKVRQFGASILDTRQVDLEFEARNVENRKLDLGIQRNLFLIFKEILVNIAKHAQAGKVKIVIQRENDHFWILVKDDGKGFDQTAIADGNGLNNMKNRAAQIGGELEVVSQPGSGTQVKMMIPIAR